MEFTTDIKEVCNSEYLVVAVPSIFMRSTMETAKDYIKDSNLTINYSYFYERIQKQEITIDELFDAICRLEIINITLNNEDNPQLIFEV